MFANRKKIQKQTPTKESAEIKESACIVSRKVNY